MTILLILACALVVLAYIVGTSESRVAHTRIPAEWVTPGNGWGRHGAHAHKTRR